MKILYYVKMLFFKHFEKVFACVSVMLISVTMFQVISTMSFDGKSGSESGSDSITDSAVCVRSVSTSSGKKIVKGKKSNKKKSKQKTKKNLKSKKKSKSKKSKKSKTKKKTNTDKTKNNKEKNRLNSAELKPKEFLNGKDEKILKKHLNKIIDDDMSNYKKAKTCYDYLINNTYYAYGGWGNAIESVLEKGFGTCTEYSYVYMAMMKYLGFNAKTVDGSTAMAAGGYGYHMWTEVKLNGNTYVFDPQVEDDMTNGKINYYRFCKTYSEVSGSYIK